MNWLDTLLSRGIEAKRDLPREVTAGAVIVAGPRRKPPEIKTVPVQTGQPFGGSPGAITVGYYSVQDDVVVMHDQNGSPTGKREQLAAGQDPRQVAWRLTRESWQAKTPDFNRPLQYPRSGIA